MPEMNKHLSMLDYVNLDDPNSANWRDFVWLVNTPTRYCNAVIKKRGSGIWVYMNEPHIVGVDDPSILVTISEEMKFASAYGIARRQAERWMQVTAGVGERLTEGTKVNLRVGDTEKKSPVLLVGDRENETRVESVTSVGVPFDVSIILRMAPTFRRRFAYSAE